jgi:hypothetical protein
MHWLLFLLGAIVGAIVGYGLAAWCASARLCDVDRENLNLRLALIRMLRVVEGHDLGVNVSAIVDGAYAALETHS